MFARLLLLFTLVPILELALLIRIGQWIGTMPTIGIIAATGVVGALLAHREGARAWARVRDTLSAGQLPGEALLHALLVFVGGALLLTPGVLTDLAGLAFLFPPTRGRLVRRLRHSFEKRLLRRAGGIEARFWTLGSEHEDRVRRDE